MSFIEAFPSSKFISPLRLESFVVVLGTTTRRTILQLPPKKFFLMAHLSWIQSQLLQTVHVGGVIVDGEPVNLSAQTTSTAKWYLLPSFNVSTSASGSPPLLLAVRDKVTMDFGSTAAGDGTVLVDMLGYIIDDFDDVFKRYSTLSK